MPAKHSPGFVSFVEQHRPHVREVDPPHVKARLDRGEPFHLVDVREDSEWNNARLPGAAHIGRGVLERDIEDLIPDKHADIVLYCGGGYRSVLAAANLQQMGYDNVASMAGGFRAWKEARLPLET